LADQTPSREAGRGRGRRDEGIRERERKRSGRDMKREEKG